MLSRFHIVCARSSNFRILRVSNASNVTFVVKVAVTGTLAFHVLLIGLAFPNATVSLAFSKMTVSACNVQFVVVHASRPRSA
jgi:hypothetical protein